MKIHRQICFAALLATFSIAQSAAAEPLRIAYTSIGIIFAPLWTTQAAGIFKKYGLDAELLYIGGGPPSLQALLAGDVKISFTAAGAAVSANLAGSDVVLLGTTCDTLPFEIWSVPSIKTPEALKGTKMGVTRIGSTSDFVGRYVLKKWGLKPGTDVTLLQAGAGPEVFAALKSGAVQSGVMSAGPYTTEAEKDGFFRLADIATLGLAYPFGPFAALRSFIRAQPDTVSRFMRAYVEGIHRFKTDRRLALATLEKQTRLKTTPAIERTYDIYVQRYIKSVPEATTEDIQTILEEVGASRPLPPGVAPQRFVEPRFINEIVSSGFADALYRRR
ncbi:MAG TPA: ABC transporter substrate-binding protein [Verrucomicrobiae bacterium]|jgi:NitT/TauT family transport system substrate-binding protein|nr:ABC transporter substrate-binding protein [Verrucomicrobiae bacterium]